MLHAFGQGIVVAFVDFILVFLILGGLAGVIKLLERFMLFWEAGMAGVSAASQRQQATATPTPVVEPELPALSQEEMKTHVAVLTATVSEFTSLTPGTFKIDYITPCGTQAATAEMPLPARQVAAIAGAMHEFLAAPAGSLRITGIQPVGAVSPWKVAGRIELTQRQP